MDLPFQEFTGSIREGHPHCYDYLECMCFQAEGIINAVKEDGIAIKLEDEEFMLESGDYWVPDGTDIGASGQTSGLVAEEYRVFFPKTGEDGQVLRNENGETIDSDVPDPEFEYWHGQDEETRAGLFESITDPVPIQRMAAQMSGDMDDLQGLTGARWFTKMSESMFLLHSDGETSVVDLVDKAVRSGKSYLIDKDLL